MDFKLKIKSLLATVFPANRAELMLFGLSAFAYGAFATIIALRYRIIFDNRIPWDAYFSFDNRSIVLTGGGFERHPLANYFFDVLRSFAFACSGGREDEVFRLVLALCSALAVSFSVLQVWKYLRNIVRLPQRFCVMLCIFFGMFSTCILLSFTPETYTYTLLLLCLYNYYAALKLRKGQGIPALPLTVAAVSIGGLTVTNLAKVYIPVLFERDLFKNFRNILNGALRFIVSAAAFALLYLYRLDFDVQRIFSKTGEQYEKFSQPKAVPIWDMVLSWFFGGNVFFSGFTVRDYHSRTGFQYKALFMDVFSAPALYFSVIILLALVVWSLLKNRKNRLALVLGASFLVDIGIHCILRFGLHTSYIYGGHFVFVYPLLLGWLLHAYRDSRRMLTVIAALILAMSVFLAGNNIYRLTEFFEFLNRYYV